MSDVYGNRCPKSFRQQLAVRSCDFGRFPDADSLSSDRAFGAGIYSMAVRHARRGGYRRRDVLRRKPYAAFSHPLRKRSYYVPENSKVMKKTFRTLLAAFLCLLTGCPRRMAAASI